MRESQQKVLKNPAPYVLFQNFGSSSLDFELRCYTSDIWSGWSIPSELRFEIDRRFREEGIEIPFNQLVVHRGGEVSEESLTQFYARRKNAVIKNSSDNDAGENPTGEQKTDKKEGKNAN